MFFPYRTCPHCQVLVHRVKILAPPSKFPVYYRPLVVESSGADDPGDDRAHGKQITQSVTCVVFFTSISCFTSRACASLSHHTERCLKAYSSRHDSRMISKKSSGRHLALFPSIENRPYRDVFVCLQKAHQNRSKVMDPKYYEMIYDIEDRAGLDAFMTVCLTVSGWLDCHGWC